MKRLLGFIVILISLHATISYSTPSVYGVVGIGISNMPHIKRDGYWYQEPFAHSFTEYSGAWRLGFGMHVNRYISIELDYRDLGTFKGSAGWVNDLYYDPVAHVCRSNCDPDMLWSEGRTRGPAVSFVLSYPMSRMTPFFRYGVFQSNYHWRVDFTNRGAGLDGVYSWQNNGTKTTRFYGVGVAIGEHWTVEYNHVPSAVNFFYEPMPGFEVIHTLLINYRF